MSYRNYLLKSLNRNDLMNTTKSAPKGVRYCNGLCQDFRAEEEFSNKIPTCRTCRNKINLAEKQIKEKTITLEQFKNNPDIIEGVEYTFETNKTCNVCKEEKSINQFEASKSVCKACRSIQAVERNNKDIDILIADVEKAKNNLVVLENFVKSIPKDKLVKVISHFEIGRKSTDKKENMVYNVVNHFKKLLHPKLCQGGCGATLESDFETCLACDDKKDKPRAVSKMIHFTENLDDIVENLTEITEDKFDVYNREQLYRIHEKLTNIKPKQKTLKEDVIKMINEELKKKKEEKEKISYEIELQNKLGGEITLNGFTILARKDGFVNATALCKAGNKKFNDWYRLDSTKELIKVFEAENLKTENPPLLKNTETGQFVSGNYKSLDIKKGGNDKKAQGSWIHPDLAIQLAQWISPIFALQVSSWVRKLSTQGYVIINNESEKDKIIKEREKEIEYMQNKHNKILEKREHHKFKKGPIFYIISDDDSKSIKFKPGIDGVSVNERLRQHRSTEPATKLEYLIYTKDNDILEKNILKRYKVKRTYQNHEWIFNMSKEHIINSVKFLLDFLNIEYTEETDLTQYNKDILP